MQRICKKHWVARSRVTCYLPFVALALIVGMTAREDAQPAAPAALSGNAGFTKAQFILLEPSAQEGVDENPTPGVLIKQAPASYRFGDEEDIRVFRSTSTRSSQATQRDGGTALEGEFCNCDSDCASSGNQCEVVICSVVTGGRAELDVGEQYTCQLQKRAHGARCDLDGLFCTADECDGAGACVVDPDVDADGPCLNRCDGNSQNFNETCEKDSDCQGGVCLDVATCDEANDICVAPGGDVGRCCAYDINGDVDIFISGYKSAATCFTDGGTTWRRVQDTALQFRCPTYSAGIASTFDGGGALVPPAVGTEIGPVRRTDKVCAFDLTPCEDAALDCLKVCVQSNGQLPTVQPKSCTDNNECVTLGDGTATCQTQTCDPLICGQDASHTLCAPGEQMRCPGDFRIGDDYAVSNGSFMALKQFSYRGGVDHSNQTLFFDFWDGSGPARCSADGAACGFIGESCAGGAGLCWGPMRINAFGVAHDSNVTSDVITIEVDCGPNDCFGDTDALENPAFRIAGTGYVTMRSTRAFGGRANGYWRTSGTPDTGTNDDTRGWRNGGPITDDSLVAGTNNDILAFELVGELIPEPLGACCGINRLVCSDSGLSVDCVGKLAGDACGVAGTCSLSYESCDDIHRYECRTCVSVGPRLGQLCSATRECSPLGSDESRCSDIGWKGARFNATTPKDCASQVCDIGGCCNNGVCTDLLLSDCNSGTFLGLGSTCNAAVTRQQGGSTTPFTDPNHNCCPQTPTAGDCCEDTPYCAGDASDITTCNALGDVGTNCGSLFCEFYPFDFVCSEAGGDADCGQGAAAGAPCGVAGTCGVPCGGVAGDNCSSTPYCAGVIGNPPCELECSEAGGDCTNAAIGSACGGAGTCQTATLGSACFGTGTCTQSVCVQPTCQFCTGPVVHTFDVLGMPTTACSSSSAICDATNFNFGVCDCPQNVGICNYVCAADSGANTGNPCSLATEAIDCSGGTCGVQVAAENEFCVTGLPFIAKSISGTRPFKDDPQNTGLSRVFDFDDGDDCSFSETDAGYYEVFSLNDFSRVTVDLCCNNPTRTAYFALFEACTCTGYDFILSNIGQAGTGDTGLYGEGNNKADLQCSLNSNLSMTFNLPPGRYAYPLQANRSCTVTGNDCDDITDCPAGEQCFGEVEREYQMHLTVVKAQRAACCTGVTCSVVTKLECEGNDHLPTASPFFPGGPNSVVLGGNWLGLQGPEDAIVGMPVADCSLNICTLGACCGGASGVDTCDDTPNGGVAGDGLDEATCAARTGGQGIYQGGVRCVDDPCPACPLGESISCQKSFDSISSPSDRQHAFRVADDFIPLNSDINRICWSGVWSGQEGGVNCNNDPPDTTWYLTIYQDDGNGLPDMNNIVLGPESPVMHDGRKITDLQATFKPTTYSAPVTITGLAPGNCYWLEIQGEGSGDLNGEEACRWEWMRTDRSGSNQGEQAKSEDGNGWSVSVAGNHPVPYTDSHLLRSDYAWCVDSGIQKNTVGNEGIDGGCGDRTGTFACCYRDALGASVCTSTVSLFKCILGEADNGLSGTVFTGQVCPDGGGIFSCTPPANDDCVTGAEEILQATCTAVTDIGNCAKNKSSWCTRPGTCPGGDGNCIKIKDANAVVSDNQFDCAIVQTDNRFATTDGPPDMDNATVLDDCSASSSGGGPFRADVWYRVTPPCSGVMSMSMCGGGVYDAMMAAYTQCPDGNDNSAPDLIGCNDDACGSLSTVSEVTPFPVVVGDEVIIRVGGYSPNSAGTPGSGGEAGQGLSQLHVRFACFPAALNPPSPLTAEAGFTKDRYVSIDPTTNGTENVSIRVTRVGSTTDKYVDCASLEDKGADGWYASLKDGPLPAPGDATYYCDWSTVTSGLHIRGCSVVPGNNYNLDMTLDGTTFSVDLQISTTPPQAPTREFGDLVGGFVTGAWTAPDGLVTTNDIVAAVRKFGLDPNAPLLARVDTDGAVPNTVASSGDILREVRAFAGDVFGFGVTGCATGQCVPVQAGGCEDGTFPVDGKCCFSIGEPDAGCVDSVTIVTCNTRPAPRNFEVGAVCTDNISLDCPPPTGKCCSSIGLPGADCVDGVTVSQCNALLPPRNFEVDAFCTGNISTDCPAPTSPIIDLVPVGSSGSFTINGNEITIPAGGVVELALRISDWGVVGDSLIESVQAKIDGSGYCSGQGAPLNPLGYPGAPVLSCPQGNGCPTDGNTCSDGAFVVKKRCTIGFVDPPTGDPCSITADCPGEFCLDDPTYLFFGFVPLSPIAFPGLDYEFAGVSTMAGKADGGLSEYFATLLVEVPASAAGTYTIDFINDTTFTFMLDGNSTTLPIGTINPASIVVIGGPTGACCTDAVGFDPCTVTSQDDCETNLGGTYQGDSTDCSQFSCSCDVNNNNIPDVDECACANCELMPPGAVDVAATGGAFKVVFLDGTTQEVLGLADPSSAFGRSDPFMEGDPEDGGATIIGGGLAPYANTAALALDPCVFPSNFPENADCGQEIHVEILSLNLTNGTEIIKAGQPFFDSAPALYQDSFGEAQGECIDLPADIFFNAFFELDLGAPPKLYNKNPVVLRATLQNLPIDLNDPGEDFINDPSFPAVALFDDSGIHRAYLVSVSFGDDQLANLPPTSCQSQRGISTTISFDVDDLSNGAVIDAQPNHVNDDAGLQVQQVTVYRSGDQPAEGPDNGNVRYNDLIGQIGGVGGFDSNDVINSLSFGRDGTLDPLGADPVLLFSVDRTSIGKPCTDVNTESSQIQVAADIFIAQMSAFGSHTSAASPVCLGGRGSCLVLDQTSLGLRPAIGGFGHDNMTALEISEYDPMTDLAYLTFTGPSFQISATDEATIWKYTPPPSPLQPGNLNVFASAASMGLQAGDVIDALAVSDATPGIDVALDPQIPNGVLDVGDNVNKLDEVLFSLTANSPTVIAGGHSGADIFYSFFNGSFSVHVTADNLGLLPGDEVDAIDVSPGTSQNDCNRNGIDDQCDIDMAAARGENIDINNSGIPDDCETRNRYVMFAPDNVGTSNQDIAYRITMLTGPGSTGVLGWIGAPEAITSPDVHDVSLVLPLSTPLSQVARPAWEPVIDVSDCEIVPAAIYGIQATTDGVVFTPVHKVRTILKPEPREWGDAVGSFVGSTWTIPDGIVTTSDIVAAVKKFQLDPQAPDFTRMDLDSEVTNRIVTAADILAFVIAFEGDPYPYSNPTDCP